MIRVLFVCTGNICRSPIAHGLLDYYLRERGLTDRIVVDSAATHAYRLDEPPDAFAITVASRHGLDIGHLRSRRIERADFFGADRIMAMDSANISALHAAAPSSQGHKIGLLPDYMMAAGTATLPGEIADPYGQPLARFEVTFDLIDRSVRGLLRVLCRRHAPASADGR